MTGPTMLERLSEPDGLATVFQPILTFRNGRARLHAFEALARGPRDTNLATAEVLFEYVRRKGEVARIDRLCVARALNAARDLPDAPVLSLNVHAATLSADTAFTAYLVETAAAAGIAVSSLVVEIVEHAPCWDGAQLGHALAALRAAGVRIALDDIGLGHSNFRMILECRPEYYKIDRYVVRGAAGDPHRRAVLAALARLAEGCGGLLVAEGVENAPDLETAVAQGVTMVQGFLTGAPRPAEQWRLAASRNEMPLPPRESTTTLSPPR